MSEYGVQSTIHSDQGREMRESGSLKSAVSFILERFTPFPSTLRLLWWLNASTRHSSQCWEYMLINTMLMILEWPSSPLTSCLSRFNYFINVLSCHKKVMFDLMKVIRFYTPKQLDSVHFICKEVPSCCAEGSVSALAICSFDIICVSVIRMEFQL